MIPLPGHSVFWNTWDPDRRVTEHHVAHGAEIGPNNTILRDPDIVDAPQHVIDQVAAIQAKELRTNEIGRYHDPKAGQVRWVPEDEYEAHMSRETVAARPENRFPDDVIVGWDTNTAIAQVNTVPGLAVRVKQLEEARKYTRKAVVDHCDRVLEAAAGRDVSLKPADT